MPKYFQTIKEAKDYARERVKLDEEDYHIAWDSDYQDWRVVNGFNKLTMLPVAAISDPELRFGTELEPLDKQVFATIKTDVDRDGQLTMSLDIEQWKLVAQMLDVEHRELGDLSNEEIELLDKLKERGIEWSQ